MQLSRADQHFLVLFSAILLADIILSSLLKTTNVKVRVTSTPTPIITGKRGNRIEYNTNTDLQNARRNTFASERVGVK